MKSCITIRFVGMGEMVLKDQRKKGFFMQALEDGFKKAVEMCLLTIAVGLPPQVIFLSSIAVFTGSLMFKALMFRTRKEVK